MSQPPNMWEIVLNTGQNYPGSSFITTNKSITTHCFAKSLKSILVVTDKGGSAGASTLTVQITNLLPIGDLQSTGSTVITHTNVTDATALPFNESQNYIDQTSGAGIISSLISISYLLTGTRTWRFYHYLIGKM